jgi:hypothetical protein
MSTHLKEFLEHIVPKILLELQYNQNNSPNFIIIGTRAVNAYIPPNKNIQTEDWDILFLGDEKEQSYFVDEVISLVIKKGYSINVIDYNKSINLSDNSLDIKSRSWYRLSLNIPGLNNRITFLDIYRSSTTVGTIKNKNGLLYSDLGFLMKSNYKQQKDVIDMIKNISQVDVNKLVNVTEKGLKTVEAMLNSIEYKKQTEQLMKIKKKLIRINEEKELLLGLVVNKDVSKDLQHNICLICSDFEIKYKDYTELADRCRQIKNSCK